MGEKCDFLKTFFSLFSGQNIHLSKGYSLLFGARGGRKSLRTG